MGLDRLLGFDAPLPAALLGLLWLIWLGLETTLLARAGPALLDPADRASALGIIGSVGLAGAATSVCAALQVGPLGPGARWLGLGLMAAGLLLRLWALWTLGRFFTAVVRTHAGQRVVSHGPYRYLRHPSYTGTFATLLGFGLALGTGAGALLMVALPLPAYGYRMRVEERALLAALGADYAAYMRRTWRLIPGLW